MEGFSVLRNKDGLKKKDFLVMFLITALHKLLLLFSKTEAKSVVASFLPYAPQKIELFGLFLRSYNFNLWPTT